MAQGIKRSVGDERRFLPGSELRVVEGAKPKIQGYGAVFSSWSERLGGKFGFREKIRPGAFTDTIQSSDVRGLWNHDRNFVLGRTKSGTLKLAEDSRGVHYEIDPPDATWAKDLMESIRRGDVDGSSFGFRTLSDQWGSDEQGDWRELIKVELLDMGPVTYPAYTATTAQARTLAGLGVQLDEFADAFARVRRGDPIDAATRAVLSTVSQALASVPVAPAEPGEPARDGQPAGDEQRRAAERFAVARRRLDLAAFE